MKLSILYTCAFALAICRYSAADDVPSALRLGLASHAFDHLGGISNQADAAAASGATIIYATGIGGLGYSGLPAPNDFAKAKLAATEYVRHARSKGIKLALGYICATSIVNLETFDKNWPASLRARFHSPPSDWRQQGRDGRPLPSWYGGDYQPACMNNPDWREYEKYIVRLQIESGHDGIFFDNPTVHPKGCFCPHCMASFARFLGRSAPPDHSTEAMRQYADGHSDQFLRFRSTIARDFLAEMRTFARTLNRHALMTCNNSLNAPGVFFSQCRTYAYNIHELSKTEDFVVVEDMGHQPRTLPDGRTMEYGPVYQLIQAISHGKPVVAVTIAEADYHTPPNLMRLAMAEAAANGASYLSWPTWPEAERAKMITAIRPLADLLRTNASLLNDTHPRRDVVLYLPFQRWLKSDRCRALDLAEELSRENIPYAVISDDRLPSDNLSGNFPTAPLLLIESHSVIEGPAKAVVASFEEHGGRVVYADGNLHWQLDLDQERKRSLVIAGPPTVRAVVRDQAKRTIVHLLNLNIQRLSSFQDRVEPARDIHISVSVPFKTVRTVRAITADAGCTSGAISFSTRAEGSDTWVEFTVARLDISTTVMIEK